MEKGFEFSSNSSCNTQLPQHFIRLQVKSTEDPMSSFHGKRGLESLEASLLDLIIAGSDTTSLALSFSVLYMVRFPEVQRKAQEEIDRVVGRDRAVSLADRPNTPYVEAVVEEVIRYSRLSNSFNVSVPFPGRRNKLNTG